MTSCRRGIHQTVPVFGATADVERSFTEGRHHVEYKAVDETGNYDSCAFAVHVTGAKFDDVFLRPVCLTQIFLV